MDPCPYAPKKANQSHNLCVVLPDTDGRPFVLFCDRCGATKHVGMEAPVQRQPLDDMSASAIAYWTSDKGTS